MSEVRSVAPAPRRDALLTYLPLAGALPFVVAALFSLTGVSNIALPLAGEISVQTIMAAYALAILSFMAGVHWGQYLARAHSSTAILVLSNVVTVAGWLAMLVLPLPLFLSVAAGLFVVLLLVDWLLAQSSVLAPTYFRIRLIVTFLVVASLLIAAV